MKRKIPTFALIIPKFEDIFHSYYAGEIIKGVCLAASRLKVDVLIHIADRFEHRAWLDPFLLNPNFIEGILFADIESDPDIVKRTIDHGMPYLVLNNIFNEPINYVAVDNEKAAYEAVGYLIKQGHTQIATIAGDLATQAGSMRLKGFQAAMAKQGLSVPKNYVMKGGFLRTPARTAAEKLLGLPNPPTAIFAASDVMALEVIDVAHKKGMEVPADLSVVGFDNNPLILTSSVKLTTVAQPLIEMGRQGLENLYQITRAKAKLPVKMLLPTKLIVNKSTKSII